MARFSPDSNFYSSADITQLQGNGRLIESEFSCHARRVSSGDVRTFHHLYVLYL